MAPQCLQLKCVSLHNWEFALNSRLSLHRRLIFTHFLHRHHTLRLQSSTPCIGETFAQLRKNRSCWFAGGWMDWVQFLKNASL